MPPPDLSVVVVNYDGRGVLGRCVASLARACRRLAAEILVVDNASTDGSADEIRGAAPVRLIESPTNLGYAGGANLGLAAAGGRFLVVSNHDVVVEEDALAILVEALEARPRIGLLGPALLDPAGARLDTRVGDLPTLPSVVARRVLESVGVERLCRRRPAYLRLFGEGRPDDHAGPVAQVSGAFLAVRRQALESVGPMDDGYFLFLEETDWCRRMWAAGWEVHAEPRAVVHHATSHATGRLADRAALHDRSLVRYLARHRGATEAHLFRLVDRLLLGPISIPRHLYLAARNRWQVR